MNNILLARVFCEFFHSAFYVVLNCVLLTTRIIPDKLNINVSWVCVVIFILGFAWPVHGNPTVTFMKAVMGKLKIKHAICYVIAQFLGVVMGNLMVSAFFPKPFITATTYVVCPNIPKKDDIYHQELPIVVVFLVFYEILANPFLELYSWNVPALPGYIYGSCYKADRFHGGATLNLARTIYAAIKQNDFANLKMYFASHLSGVLLTVVPIIYPVPQQHEYRRNFNEAANIVIPLYIYICFDAVLFCIYYLPDQHNN